MIHLIDPNKNETVQNCLMQCCRLKQWEKNCYTTIALWQLLRVD